MRRRSATPKQPLLNDATASKATMVVPGLGRGAPPPPPPPPEQARVFVYRLMLAGASREKIADMASVNVPPFGRELVFRIYSDICHELGDAANLPEHSREHLRAQASERLRNELVGLRMRRMGKVTEREYLSLSREVRHLEDLLADIEGTRRPIEIDVAVDVDVRVRSASLRIVSELSADELAEMGRELAELRR